MSDYFSKNAIRTFDFEDLDGLEGTFSVSSDEADGYKVTILSFFEKTTGNIYVLNEESTDEKI